MLEQNWKSLIHFSASADNHFDPHKYSKLCGGGTWRRGGWHRWRGQASTGLSCLNVAPVHFASEEVLAELRLLCELPLAQQAAPFLRDAVQLD